MSHDSVLFCATGDIALGDHPLCAGYGAYSRFLKEERLFPFLKSLDVLRRSDVLFGNLECVHSMAGLRRNDYSSIQMRGDPRHIPALADAGFSIVNVANNHSMQHGDDAFLDSVRRLQQSNISCCGTAADGTTFSTKPAIIRKKGLIMGFLGYSLRPRQYFSHVPLYAEGKPEAMERDVQTLRAQADAVIVSLHWGEEFIQRPSPEEIRIARRLVDAGADLIIGHHPHVLRGIERRGRSCIVYSLGNFVADMLWDESLRTSLIFECTISGNGIQDVNLVPTYINADLQPEILAGARAEAVLHQLDQLTADISRSHEPWDVAEDQRYLQEADSVHRRIRAKSHRYFLSRIWKYPAPILIQQLGTYVRNRLHERFNGN